MGMYPSSDGVNMALIKEDTLTSWTDGGSFHTAYTDLTAAEKTELGKYNSFVLYALYERPGFDYPFFDTVVVAGIVSTLLNTGRFCSLAEMDANGHYLHSEVTKTTATSNNVRVQLYDFGKNEHKSGKIYLYGIK